MQKCEAITVHNNFERLTYCPKKAEIAMRVAQGKRQVYCVPCAKEVTEAAREMGLRILAHSL